jgi:proline utilization trans-activator
MLVESIHSTDSSQSGIQGIKGARDILRYLSSCGNKAAERRLHDVQQLCEHLSISLDSPVPQVVHTRNGNSPSKTTQELSSDTVMDAPAVDHTTSLNPCQTDSTSPLLEDLDWRQALASFQTSSDMFTNVEMDHAILTDSNTFDQFDGFNFDISGNFMLTGADETDWEQFERQIMRNNE